MKIELSCAACGSNNFELAEVEIDGSDVACGDCGHQIGTLGELKSKLAEEVLRHSRRKGDGAVVA